MINLTVISHAVGKFAVKYGPKILSVGGAAMTIGGAVMACRATLKADEVLEAHQARINKLEMALAVSEGYIQEHPGEELNEADIFTEKDYKRGKFEAYCMTAIDFIKLYAPAVSMILGGVGMMQAAFWTTEHKRATAVAALTSVEQAYSNLIEAHGNNINPEPMVHEKREVILDGEDEPSEQVILDPNRIDENFFFFLYDEDNPNWTSGPFSNGRWGMNISLITSRLNHMQYDLSGYRTTHYLVNDVARELDLKETAIGHFFGWNAMAGDQIEYKIFPYRKVYETDNDTEPLLLPITLEELKKLEAQDIQTGYCIGIQLYSSHDGSDDLTLPRYIYPEIFENDAA